MIKNHRSGLRILLVLVVSILSAPVIADYLVISRSSLVKVSPEPDGVLIERVGPGIKLQLLNEGQQTNGYYHVWAPTAKKEGWVHRSRVRRRSGDLPGQVVVEVNSQAGFDGAHCGPHLRYGTPHSSDLILCRKGYAVGYNFKQRTPDWVAYYLTRDTAHGDNVDRGSFRVDRQLPKEHRSGGSDYDGSGFDKGHLAPSAAIDFSRSANDETFFYSNMAPQLPGFNRNMFGRTGVWGAVEDHVRDWLRQDRRELYIIAGTFFDEIPQTIGRGVGIPDRFFKIIYDPIKQDSISFWMAQDEDTADRILDYVTSIDVIEKKTGFDFFQSMNDEIESLLESEEADSTKWGLI